MKSKIPVALALLFTAVFAHADTATDRAQQAEQAYQKGMQAVNAGNVAVARQQFTLALQQNPNHAHANYQLRELNQKGNLDAIAKKAREKQFNAVIIPEVNFTELSVQEFAEAMAKLIERESKGAFAPNFVVQDPQGAFANRKVTLQLKNIPARKLLDYALNSVGGRVEFEEHATVIKPSGRAQPQ